MQEVATAKLERTRYRFQCTVTLVLMLKTNSRDFIFARTFLIICWNLMSRAANAFSVCFDAMAFHEDSLQIIFSQMKNDQFGERPREARHIYANPIIPAICPILALGIYWLCFPVAPNQIRLFPGGSQYDRFRKALQRFLERPEVAEELSLRGLAAKDLGSHSVRKGAATYASSGSTACPPAAAIHLRAGWSMGGVQNTYIRYEAAGDMYVGRTVCGLPGGKPEFAILPPSFGKDCSRGTVAKALSHCFPGLPPGLNVIAEHALASILYHQDFLRETVPSGHPLLRTLPFRNDVDFITELKGHVECRLSPPGDEQQPTGVPPHVTTLTELRGVTTTLERCVNLQSHYAERIINQTADRIIKDLEERAIEARTVTTDGLRSTISDSLRDLVGSVKTLLERDPARSATGVASASSEEGIGRIPIVASAEGSGEPGGEAGTTIADGIIGGGAVVYYWKGRFHSVPQGFQLPNGSVSQAWQLWCCGDQEGGRRLPPLKNLDPIDLESRNAKKRLSEYKFLMGLLEDKAKELGLWKSNLSLTEAIFIFEACKSVVEVPEVSGKNRKRRVSQLSWVTVATLKRKKEI